MLDIECQLVETFGWTLKDIDETDIESLVPFIFHFPHWKQRAKAKSGRRMVYADQAGWL